MILQIQLRMNYSSLPLKYASRLNTHFMTKFLGINNF